MRAAHLIACILISMCILPVVSGVRIVDSTTGSPITQGVLRWESSSGTYHYVLTADGAPLTMDEEGLVLVRISDTETYEFYAHTYPQEPAQPIVVRPAGLVMGEVKDARANLVAHATIIASCPGERFESSTDATGHFRIVLPAERCLLATKHKGMAGSADVVISQGEVSRTQLDLTSATANRWSLWLLIAAAVVALAMIALGIRVWRSRTRFVAEQVKPVLTAKEERIIDELLLRKGRARLPELRTALGLPRTSLLRTIESLEHRGLVVKKCERGKVFLQLAKK